MSFDELHFEEDNEYQCTDINEQLQCPTSNNKFSVLHLNIRSLNKHHDELTSLISDTGYCFNIIGCSETWLNDKSYTDTLNLEGYALYYKNRPDRRGGVCLYVHSSMHVKVRDDLVINDNCTDSLFVEVKINKSKNLIVGAIYRPRHQSIYF